MRVVQLYVCVQCAFAAGCCGLLHHRVYPPFDVEWVPLIHTNFSLVSMSAASIE